MQGQQRRIGRFELGPTIGHGGMGVVYRARDTGLGRDVALKLIAPSLADDADFRARFESEARAAAAVDHPNVLPLFDGGEVDGELYLAMRLVEGTDLKAILTRESRLPPRRVAAIIAQIAGALDAAHARGLVHRDVKPANVLIVGEGDREHLYLTDFGLTQIVGGSGHLTNAGQVVGTANYMAPEQIEGQPVDGRVDVYALACVAFECLGGAPPFARGAIPATLDAHRHAQIPSVTERAPALPRDVDDALAGGLAKDPAQRFASCGAFARALGAALGTDSGEVPRDPEVALRARPRGAALPPPPHPVHAPTAPTEVAAPRPSSRRGAWALTTLLALLLAAGAVTAAATLLPPLLDGRGGTSADRTLELLSGANSVNTDLSALISRLVSDPTDEAERGEQRRRLPALGARIRELRSAAGVDAVDSTVRPSLLASLRAQEQLLDKYGSVLDADPAEAQPLIEDMLATLARAEARLPAP